MKTIKRNLSIFALVFIMVATCSPSTQADAATKFTRGKLCYQVTGCNTVTVSDVCKKYETTKNLTVPSTVTCNGKTYKVTKISNNAFADCDNLKTVKCPSTLSNRNYNCIRNVSIVCNR
ncbi:leucine-rich repeat domain-containing protein [Anaeromicropila populeti]|uniref:Leucine rich repeat-containing protein n=1 Tax=Anaeromicropila populeti TaxID=37658 RepID=A0A1I6IMV4_9FIRM|nr:hypothetical protein [Anaeromicropila populeti]SFR68048.1 hypothetical protein SAMN05661086_00919 [Anaeromicropila populeti]